MLFRSFNFLDFFAIFFQNFLARVMDEWISGLIYFSLFFGPTHPFWLEIMPERGFFNFLNFFCNFSLNFLSRVEYERNSGVKFFYLFFSLSHPDLATNNARKRFLNFLNFFLFISEFSCPGRV